MNIAWLALSAALLAGTCLAEAPQLRVEARLEPASRSVVGETVQLHLDVLTDTWFTSAPSLGPLEVDNAIVTAPSGEARHLNLNRDGTPFFGLEFTWQITPTASGALVIPPITVSATPGTSSEPLQARSEALRLTVEQPAGVAVGQSVLVAKTLTVEQNVSPSNDNLSVGDSVRRQIKQSADGAQAMLMPAPEFVEIDGLKRYVEPPQVQALGDGRGTVSGGQRIDVASYVVTRGGDFQLPALRVQWWDSSARQLRSAEVPAVSFKASATPAFSTPFSMKEDVQRLGRHGRISLSRHWLGVSFCALLLLGMGYAARPWWQRGLRAWQARRGRKHQRWLASPDCARQQIPEQLRATPARHDALYLWARRLSGATGLQPLQPSLPPDLTEHLYGRHPQPAVALADLLASPAVRHASILSKADPNERHGLRPLNPRTMQPAHAFDSSRQYLRSDTANATPKQRQR
jgi:hypothetical protein